MTVSNQRVLRVAEKDINDSSWQKGGKWLLVFRVQATFAVAVLDQDLQA